MTVKSLMDTMTITDTQICRRSTFAFVDILLLCNRVNIDGKMRKLSMLLSKLNNTGLVVLGPSEMEAEFAIQTNKKLHEVTRGLYLSRPDV